MISHSNNPYSMERLDEENLPTFDDPALEARVLRYVRGNGAHRGSGERGGSKKVPEPEPGSRDEMLLSMWLRARADAIKLAQQRWPKTYDSEARRWSVPCERYAYFGWPDTSTQGISKPSKRCDQMCTRRLNDLIHVMRGDGMAVAEIARRLNISAERIAEAL